MAAPYAHPGWGPKLRSLMSAAPVPTRRVWLGVFMLIATAVLWSLAGPLIKLLKEAGVDGVAIAFYRSAIGGVVFLPLALRRLGTLRNVSILWPIGSVVAFTAMTVTFVIATTMTAAANAIILQYTSPIWVFLLAPLLLRERPGKVEGLVLLIAMAGVAIIFFGHGTADISWLAVALASGLGFGTLIVVLRGLRRVNPVVVAAMNTLGSGLLLGIAVALWGSFDVTARQLGLLLVLGLVQFTLPYVMFSWALQYVEAHRAALIVLLEPTLNPLWTYLIVAEVPPPATFIGGPLILLSVVGWILLTRRRETANTRREYTSHPLE